MKIPPHITTNDEAEKWLRTHIKRLTEVAKVFSDTAKSQTSDVQYAVWEQRSMETLQEVDRMKTTLELVRMGLWRHDGVKGN